MRYFLSFVMQRSFLASRPSIKEQRESKKKHLRYNQRSTENKTPSHRGRPCEAYPTIFHRTKLESNVVSRCFFFFFLQYCSGRKLLSVYLFSGSARCHLIHHPHTHTIQAHASKLACTLPRKNCLL